MRIYNVLHSTSKRLDITNLRYNLPSTFSFVRPTHCTHIAIDLRQARPLHGFPSFIPPKTMSPADIARSFTIQNHYSGT